MWKWFLLALLPNLGFLNSQMLFAGPWAALTLLQPQKTTSLKFQTRNEPSGLRVSSVSIVENKGSRLKIKLTGKYSGFLPGKAYLTCRLKAGMNVVGEYYWGFKVQKNQQWTQFIWVNVSGESKSLSAKIEFERFIE